MAVESGVGVVVGNAIELQDTALFPFVPSIFSVSVFSAAFLSTDSTGFLSPLGSALLGVPLFVIGSSTECDICLLVGALGECCVVLTSVSLLALLGSFS